MPDREVTGSHGVWRKTEQVITVEVEAARNTCSEPTDESQPSNDKQIRLGYTEMEPADVVAVRFQT